MPMGFFFLSVGILVIMYSANKRASEEWLIWGIISMTIINAGIALLGNAYVHKVKSDMIQRNKAKKNPSALDDE